MVSKQQKLDMFQMRMEGATYQTIAKKYGISRQAAHELLHNTLSSRGASASCTSFPGLQRYMFDHHLSAARLLREIGSPMCYNHFTRKLSGSYGFNLSEIRAILRYTGLTFEQAFGLSDESPMEEGDLLEQ